MRPTVWHSCYNCACKVFGMVLKVSLEDCVHANHLPWLFLRGLCAFKSWAQFLGCSNGSNKNTVNAIVWYSHLSQKSQGKEGQPRLRSSSNGKSLHLPYFQHLWQFSIGSFLCHHLKPPWTLSFKGFCYYFSINHNPAYKTSRVSSSR